MGKIILNLAISLDGYISDEEGGFDWITGHDDLSIGTETTFEFKEFLKSVDTIVMGSKAYEDCGIENIDDYQNKRFIVATSRDLTGPENVEFYNGDICKHILDIKAESDKDIWLFGGAGLTDAFIQDDIIDEYIIGIIPTILGSGRILFIGGNDKIDLHLDNYSVHDGITILTYSKR